MSKKSHLRARSATVRQCHLARRGCLCDVSQPPPDVSPGGEERVNRLVNRSTSLSTGSSTGSCLLKLRCQPVEVSCQPALTLARGAVSTGSGRGHRWTPGQPALDIYIHTRRHDRDRTYLSGPPRQAPPCQPVCPLCGYRQPAPSSRRRCQPGLSGVSSVNRSPP